MQLITGLAALAATLPLAQAASSAIIQNNCGFPIYLWAVDINRNPQTARTIAAGESYSEQYHTLSQGGVSLKLAKTNKVNDLTTKITQFEYTLAGGKIWYDGSNVNCRGTDCPFYAEGIHMETSMASCPQRTCQPNTDCNGFYINWNDDWNSLACDDPTADIKFFICSATGGSVGSSGSGSGSSSGSGSDTAPKASATVVAQPSVVAPQPSATSVEVAKPSAVQQMDAPAPWTGRVGGGRKNNRRFVQKIKARTPDVDARDLHEHMRRHNHRRSI